MGRRVRMGRDPGSRVGVDCVTTEPHQHIFCGRTRLVRVALTSHCLKVNVLSREYNRCTSATENSDFGEGYSVKCRSLPVDANSAKKRRSESEKRDANTV